MEDPGDNPVRFSLDDSHQLSPRNSSIRALSAFVILLFPPKLSSVFHSVIAYGVTTSIRCTSCTQLFAMTISS